MRKFIFLFSITIFFAACKSTSVKAKRDLEKDEASSLIEQIINTASEYLGAPYQLAGTTKSGFDCSGLVFSVLKEFGINLPRTSIEQSKTGIDLGSNLSKAKKGDLIFFRTNQSNKINHVGIVVNIKDDDIFFIHTSSSKGVIISSTKEPYYQKTFVQLTRILP